MIKTMMLLTALSFCWQSSAFANEMEIEGERGGIKRSATQAGLFHGRERDRDLTKYPKEKSLEEGICHLMEMPTDVISIILSHLNPHRDYNTLLSLRSCTTSKPWQGPVLIEEIYTQLNKKEFIYQWQANPSLPNIYLYAFNKRLRTILSLYNNIVGYNDMANSVDQIRFESLCDQFGKSSFFSETTAPMMYVEMLRLSIGLIKDCDGHNPLLNPLAIFLKPKLDKKKEDLAYKFREVVKQVDPVNQNEGALYVHFCKFVINVPVFASIQNTEFFKQLNGCFMRLVDDQLLSLKLTPGISSAGNFAETWKKIIDLEPTATIGQLHNAGLSHFQAGREATDLQVKFENYSKAAQYFEEALKAITSGGESPTATDYHDIAEAYWWAGYSATDRQVKFENFSKAAQYYEEELKAIISRGESPTAENYSDIASAYREAARCATDRQVMFENYSKAAQYYEEELKTIISEGESPTSTDYGIIASKYRRAGDAATDSEVKFENFSKAAPYYEEKLNAITSEGQSPTVNDYEDIVNNYYDSGYYATDPQVKFKNFSKAAQYYEEVLKAIISGGENPLAENYYSIADFYIEAGSYATDLQVKFENFSKAAQYFEEALKAITSEGDCLTAMDYGTTADAYFRAGNSATDPQAKFTYFTSAKKYFEMTFKLNGHLDKHILEEGPRCLEQASAYIIEHQKEFEFPDKSQDVHCGG